MDNGGGERSVVGRVQIGLGIAVAVLAVGGFLVWGFGFRAPFGGMIPVSVHGSVIDASNGNPIDNAKVAVVWEWGGNLPPEVDIVGTTDDAGQFALDGDIGYGGNKYMIGWKEYSILTFCLLLEKDGYQPVNVVCIPPDMELLHDVRQTIQVGGLKMTRGDDSAKPKEEFLPLPL